MENRVSSVTTTTDALTPLNEIATVVDESNRSFHEINEVAGAQASLFEEVTSTVDDTVNTAPGPSNQNAHHKQRNDSETVLQTAASENKTKVNCLISQRLIYQNR